MPEELSDGELETEFVPNSGVDRGISEKDAEAFRKKINENLAYDELVSSSPHLLKSVAFAALGDAELRKNKRFKIVTEQAYGDLKTDIKRDQDGAKKVSSSELVATFVEKVKEIYQQSIKESQAQALAYMSGEKFLSMQNALDREFREEYIQGNDSVQKVVRIRATSGDIDPVLAEAEVEGGGLQGISATEFWGKYKEIANSETPHETVLGLEIVPSDSGLITLEDLGIPLTPKIVVIDATDPSASFVNGVSNRTSWEGTTAQTPAHYVHASETINSENSKLILKKGNWTLKENSSGETIADISLLINGEQKIVSFLVTGATFVISKNIDKRVVSNESSPTI